MATIKKPKSGRKPSPRKLTNSEQLLPRNESSKILTVDELSQTLKLSKSYIYTLVSKKQIPYIKLAERKVLFDTYDIANWIEERKVSNK